MKFLFMLFFLEELVKPLEDFARWNMIMDLFISQIWNILYPELNSEMD